MERWNPSFPFFPLDSIPMDLTGNSGRSQFSGGGVVAGGDEGYEYSSNPIGHHIKRQALYFGSSPGGSGHHLEAFPLSPPPSGAPSCTDMGGRSGCSPAATDLITTMVSASSPSRVDRPTAGTQRGSKKRPRASRRAPTTVLTTDTSNFRRMVQEFTGISESSFSTLSTFPGFRAATAPGIVSGSPPAALLLGPFAQKISPASSGPFASRGTSTTVFLNSDGHIMGTNNPHVASSRMEAPTAPPTTGAIPALGCVAASSDSSTFPPMGSPTLDLQPTLQYSAPTAQKSNVPAVESDADCTTDLVTSDAWSGVGGGADGGLLELVHGSGGSRVKFDSFDNACHRPAQSDPSALPKDGSSHGNLDSSWIFSSK